MSNLRTIKLTIEYDGTNYSGWQRQDNAVTIQQEIEDALLQTLLITDFHAVDNGHQ